MRVCELTIIGSDNGLSPGRCQAIIWNSDGILLNWNFNRNSYIFIQENAFENVVWEMTAILSQLQCVTGLRESIGNQYIPLTKGL